MIPSGTRRMALAASLALCLLLGVVAVAFAAKAGFDNSFGENGTTFTSNGANRSNPAAQAITEDKKGRLIAVGGSNDSFVIARYLPSGSPDPSFGGGDGLVYISAWLGVEHPELEQSTATSVAVLPDGKILVAGAIADYKPCCPHHRITFYYSGLARLMPNGKLDASFGDRGGRVLGSQGKPFTLALLPGGKFLIAGYDSGQAASGFVGYVARFHSDGSLDRNFGPKGNGAVRLRTGRLFGSGILDLSVLRSGKILASGFLNYNFLLTRLTKDGRPDRSFGNPKTPGQVVTDIARRKRKCRCSFGWGHAIDHRGRIVVAGYVAYPNPRDYMALVRYMPDGKIDRSFGPHGIVRVKVGDQARARHVAIQRDGRIVAVGESEVGEIGIKPLHFTVVRLMPDGSRDRSFFGNGVLARPYANGSQAWDVIIDHTGRPVASGDAVVGRDLGFRVSRFLPGPPLGR